jgi:hypothetical protein
MLTRVTGALFEAPAGSQVEIVARSQGNNGVEDARFEYDSVVLPRQTIMGLPGCTFTVVPTIRQFEAVVAFHPAASPAARYDLFEVNSAGGLSGLGENVTNSASAALIGFGIDGVPVPVAAAPPPPPPPPPVARAAPRRPVPAPRKKVAKKRKAAAKKSAGKPRKSASTRAPAAKKPRASTKPGRKAGANAGKPGTAKRPTSKATAAKRSATKRRAAKPRRGR